MEDKICKKCHKIIKKNEKGVTWITFEDEKELEVVHWHWQCFIYWKNESLETRAMKLYNASMGKSMNILKGIMNNGKETISTESFLLH